MHFLQEIVLLSMPEIHKQAQFFEAHTGNLMTAVT